MTPDRTQEYNPTYPPLKKLTDIDWGQFKDTKVVCSTFPAQTAIC